MKNKLVLLALCATAYAVPCAAAEQFLAQEQAFRFSAQALAPNQAELKWQIAPDYYLYQQKITVQQGQHKRQDKGQQPIQLHYPKATIHHDQYFGESAVYFDQLVLDVAVAPNQRYNVQYQGCAAKGLCYPITQSEFATDADGLVIEQDHEYSKLQGAGLFGGATVQSPWATVPHNLKVNTSQQSQTETPLSHYTITQKQIQNANQNGNQNGSLIANQAAHETARQSPINTPQSADQIWSNRLHQQSLWWSMVVFLGLGCLLAFAPCSLPMLPIVSGLLVRRHVGVRAGLITLVFVLGMASVYALLGVLAASVGSGLQRWLQQSMVLIGFSLIFIVFALNLFGVFELQLPQRWSNRLDQWQSKQQGGTLLGAAVMGMLSALLVGPCMTAPLAGTLLYISQSHNLLIGALLLFSLGIGMGLPLILLTLIGERAVPQAGEWMHSVRHVFGFIMLGVAWYFVRPMLPIIIYQGGMLVLGSGLMLYVLYMGYRHRGALRYVAGLLCVAILLWQIQHVREIYSNHQDKQLSRQQQRQSQHSQPLQWHVVHNQTEFEQALNAAKIRQQPILIDVYADWCVACQPIERHIWTDVQVQQALAHYTMVKLDLTHFDDSQQQILKQWQILGPPTVLFLDQNGAENRAQRLTGEFKRDQLLQRLQASSP